MCVSVSVCAIHVGHGRFLSVYVVVFLKLCVRRRVHFRPDHKSIPPCCRRDSLLFFACTFYDALVDIMIQIHVVVTNTDFSGKTKTEKIKQYKRTYVYNT